MPKLSVLAEREMMRVLNQRLNMKTLMMMMMVMMIMLTPQSPAVMRRKTKSSLSSLLTVCVTSPMFKSLAILSGDHIEGGIIL